MAEIEPTNEELSRYGWAPGYYTILCNCGNRPFDCDKRALRCRACALKLWNESKGARQPEKLPMPLSQAMHILCDVHTNDDPRVGFVIHVGADPYNRPTMYIREPGDYVEAWRTLRAAAGVPTKPEQY